MSLQISWVSKNMKTVVPFFHCCRSAFSNVHVQSGIFPNDTCSFSNDRVAAVLCSYQGAAFIFVNTTGKGRWLCSGALIHTCQEHPYSMFRVPRSGSAILVCFVCGVLAGLRAQISDNVDWRLA